MLRFFIVLAAAASFSTAAFAGGETEDRTAAINACRAALAAEIGVEPNRENVRFDRSRTRPRAITTHFRIRAASGVGRNAECTYNRRTAEIVLERESSSSSLAARERPITR